MSLELRDEGAQLGLVVVVQALSVPIKLDRVVLPFERRLKPLTKFKLVNFNTSDRETREQGHVRTS